MSVTNEQLFPQALADSGASFQNAEWVYPRGFWQSLRMPSRMTLKMRKGVRTVTVTAALRQGQRAPGRTWRDSSAETLQDLFPRKRQTALDTTGAQVNALGEKCHAYRRALNNLHDLPYERSQSGPRTYNASFQRVERIGVGGIECPKIFFSVPWWRKTSSPCLPAL
jgi:hypothetical protein